MELEILRLAMNCFRRELESTHVIFIYSSLARNSYMVQSNCRQQVTGREGVRQELIVLRNVCTQNMEEGMATHASNFVLEISCTEKPAGYSPCSYKELDTTKVT